MAKVKTCSNCNGSGRVWNDRTQSNDKTCPACNGTGRIVIGNI